MPQISLNEDIYKKDLKENRRKQILRPEQELVAMMTDLVQKSLKPGHGAGNDCRDAFYSKSVIGFGQL